MSAANGEKIIQSEKIKNTGWTLVGNLYFPEHPVKIEFINNFDLPKIISMTIFDDSIFIKRIVLPGESNFINLLERNKKATYSISDYHEGYNKMENTSEIINFEILPEMKIFLKKS